MKLIVFGPPGAGKGTQAEVLSEHYSIPIIGTGNMIRESMKKGTSTGKQVAEYMEKGLLVPDAMVVEILKERLSRPDTKNGYILDGFPRTVVQAEVLEEMGVEIEKVISIIIDDQEIIKRLTGRRICGECGSSYHIDYKKPKVEGICDKCGGKLIIREDDDPDIIADRLLVYHESTAPVEDFYKKRGKLVSIVSQEEISETSRLTLEALEK